MNIIDTTLGDYLKKLRKDSGLSLNDIENGTKINRSSLSYWENNQRIPNKNNLKKLANLYNVDLMKLYHIIQFAGLPIYEKAHFSVSQNNLGQITNRIEFDDAFFKLTDITDYFATKKEDDSLDKLGIAVGSIVLCRKTTKVKNGSIAIVLTDNGPLMRRIEFINNDEAYLLPKSTNETYKKIKVFIKDIDIVAQVEKVILDFL